MRIILVSFTAWFVAQLLKVLGVLVFHKKFQPSLFFASGGMPSAHSAFITSISVQIGYQSGFESSIFALSAAITLIVVYDAYNVRRSVGLQGQTINKMIEYVIDKEHDTKEITVLKEVMGHTPFQVFCGIILGIAHVYMLMFLQII